MSALTALVLFIVSFMVVAMLFKMPVSYALGFSSLLVLAFSGKNTVTIAQYAFSGLDSSPCLRFRFTLSRVF